MESQRQKILQDLEGKQTHISKQADDYDKRQKELGKVIDQLKAGEFRGILLG